MKETKNIERILIVEDKEEHIEAAKQQLDDYNLTIAQNFDEFKELVGGSVYGENKKPEFEVVLTDLNFPLEEYSNEAPIGYAAVLYSVRAKVPYVGMISATNHHEGSISESLIWVKDKFYDINGTRVRIFDDDSFGTRGLPKRWDKALECLVEGE